MAGEVSPVPRPSSSGSSGTEAGRGGDAAGNPLRRRLERAKAVAVESAMGKGDSWVRSIINDEAGVRLDDIPRLCAALGLKLVGADKVCVDRDVVEALAQIHAKLAPHIVTIIYDDEI
jgi:hypothetical protein